MSRMQPYYHMFIVTKNDTILKETEVCCDCYNDPKNDKKLENIFEKNIVNREPYGSEVDENGFYYADWEKRHIEYHDCIICGCRYRNQVWRGI